MRNGLRPCACAALRAADNCPEDKADFRCKDWAFTVNNPVKGWEAFLEGMRALGAKRLVFSEERGSTPHWQGAVMFPERKRVSQLLKLHTGHYEKMRTSWAHNVAYCTKSDTHVAGPWGFGFEAARPLVTGLEGHELYPWQKAILDMVAVAPTAAQIRQIHWFWSRDGARGKSSLVRELIDKHEACWIRFAAYDRMAAALAREVDPEGVGIRGKEKRDVQVVIMDAQRATDVIDYTFLEGLNDMLIFNTMYRPLTLRFAPVWVLVFANQEPYVSDSTLSADRFVVKCVD